MERELPLEEYEKPEIKDYGDLTEMTLAAAGGPHSDIPRGSPGPISFTAFS